ncbi:hypothetical protein [Pelosinus sp. IPA-1]|uniref:gp53-like domain-containing protein n=1 Tax=Pelosinus sp. IPA-1 TaxID=3029569 RepID=UPI0024362877|nr:hypothetical protein [Pelosinus sp. IPA-1]GMB00447.1 hypothetical protein PIPA1_32460 [Pelosinus sp. IPA-1]
MPNWSGGILTTKGQALQAKVDAGQTLLTLTKMKIGSGVLPTGQTLQGLNDLVAPEMIVPISAVSAEGNVSTITGVITNAGLTNGFNVRELGVFAQDPTLGEILYSITTDSAPDYFPPEGGAITVSEEFNYHITVSNASNVTAVLNSSGLVTVSILQQHNSDPNAHSEAIAKHNSSLNAHAGLLRLWQPIRAYVAGDICYSPTGASYKRFECTVAGTSGATEPTWPAVGSTIVDGTVTWKVVDIKNFLPLAGGMVTGDVLGITASQLDNSKKLATTEFVKKAGLQLAATAQYTAGPITLSAAQAGQLIDLASGYTGTITLPAAASIPDGSIYYFWSGANVAVPVQRSGSDTIYVNNSTVTSINLNSGDSLILMKTGAVGVGAWIAIGGTARLPFISQFGSSITGNGYQKLPSGLILQWGTAAIVSGGAVTYPIAFPNGVYWFVPAVTAVINFNSAYASAAAAPGLASTIVYHGGGTTPYNISWMAIGK